MNELSNTEQKSLSILESLGEQARMLQENINMSLFQMGRVMIQARSLCDKGTWQRWVQENTDFSQRKAEQLIQICTRFDGREEYAKLGKSTLIKMLSLPEGSEDQFMADNNVQDMTAREVEAAVRRVNEEMQRKLDLETAARKKAEQELRELADHPPELPDEVIQSMQQQDETINKQREQMARLDDIAQAQLQEANQLRRENASLNRDLKDQSAAMEDMQRRYNQMKDELLDAKSAIAKGDAERVVSDRLTADAFASAVRQFIGVVARLPHMRTAFSTMGADEKAVFDELLSTVEDWAQDAREALDTTAAEGVVL